MVELRLATSKHEKARIMSSIEEICFFQLLLKLINAKNTIEIGVFTGYSALGVALALPCDGKVVACDISKEFTDIGKPFWESAGVAKKIDLILAPGTETLDKIINKKLYENVTFDFAYVDADKANYVNYYQKLKKIIRKNGLIAFDNVLWGGKILDKESNDSDTVGIRKINELLKEEADKGEIELVMLPISDGVSFVRIL